MRQLLSTCAVLAGLTCLVMAAEPPQQTANKSSSADTTAVDEFPDGIKDFNGMLVGRLVNKDVEKGTFIMHVDAVPRVWRNSKAKSPKSILNKKVLIDGVFGKWLDVLLVAKIGETIEVEAKHGGGDNLTFPGELLRKVAPVKPGDYPELPEGFRGFEGTVIGKVQSKDGETMEIIMQVNKIVQVAEKSKAKRPESIIGKKMMVAGFWNRKDQYHDLKVGDTIECGLRHFQNRSDHLNVAEDMRKVASSKSND